MPENPKRQAEELNIQVNPTVAKLAPLAREEAVVSLTGFVGPSEADMFRLYSDFELHSYLDVPKRAVKHFEWLDEAKGEKGPARLYVPASTMVRRVSQTFQPAREQPDRPGPRTVAPLARKFSHAECRATNALICSISEIRDSFAKAGLDTSELDRTINQLLDIYAAGGCGPAMVVCFGEPEVVQPK